MNTAKRLTIVLIVALAIGACQSDPPIIDVTPEARNLKTPEENRKEGMVHVNKEIVRLEEQFIDNYIQRHNLDVTRAGNGIRYQIYKPNPEGKSINDGDRVSMIYSSRLLTGTMVEDKEEDENQTFNVNASEQIQGLHFAAMNMREGEKGIFIIPSKLAYGVTGKRGEVPHNAALVYDIQITKVNR